MARVFNTNQIIDTNNSLLNQLYEGYVEKPLAELSKLDLDRGEVIRCLAELRLYHLPPYYSVPASIKSRLQSSGSLLVNAEDPTNSLTLEREMMYANSNIFGGIELKSKCTCGKSTKLIEGLCTTCHLEDLYTQFENWKTRRAIRLSELYDGSQLQPHLIIDPKDIQEFLTTVECLAPLAGDSYIEVRTGAEEWFRAQGGMNINADIWTSPKKTLFATELGCSHCATKIESDFIWTEDLAGWTDGLCPACASLYHTRQSWSHNVLNKPGLRQVLRTVPDTYFERCQYCQKDTYDYAIWGMCEECYIEWQDSYLDVTKLWDLASRHGSLSTLLIRPSIDWLGYIRTRLPVKQKTYLTHPWDGDMKELTLRPDKLLRSSDKRRTKKVITLADAGVNVDEVLARCK